jgi:hypothetical protein
MFLYTGMIYVVAAHPALAAVIETLLTITTTATVRTAAAVLGARAAVVIAVVLEAGALLPHVTNGILPAIVGVEIGLIDVVAVAGAVMRAVNHLEKGVEAVAVSRTVATITTATADQKEVLHPKSGRLLLDAWWRTGLLKRALQCLLIPTGSGD